MTNYRLFSMLSLAVIVLATGCVDVNVKEMPPQQLPPPISEVFVTISDFSADYVVRCYSNNTINYTTLNALRVKDSNNFFSYIYDGQVPQKVTIVHPIVMEDDMSTYDVREMIAPPNDCRLKELVLKYHINVTIDGRAVTDRTLKLGKDISSENFESVVAMYYDSVDGWKELFGASFNYRY